ncbi:RsmF rRNA methyltransferase first C-terminal domain-containing protein [Caldalkalibacillus mannanilyticus]|uniref:RsmF rRNA methyltransferase first C-terminal domain-containing protein n=1 Tax=Caldalkalibacillus mannanilyticus TaxID=1418 RepID=UPI000B1D3458|nr:RsmF rRNA methyltransferase first C-terminal domain-containing protein [Caldalkalibacillus mannanilyticus]
MAPSPKRRRTLSCFAPKTGSRTEDVPFSGRRIAEKELVDFRNFEKEVLNQPIEEIYEGDYAVFKGHLYSKPKNLPSLQGLKVIKSGWYLGELKKNRFEPSQSLAMGLRAEHVKEPIVFTPDDERLHRYLRGETLHLEGQKGWKLVTVDGYSLGWAKQVQGILKNAYPPGWRWLT